MKPRIGYALACLLVVLSACGGGPELQESPAPNADDERVTTTVPETETTVPDPATTTSTAPSTTTSTTIQKIEESGPDPIFSLADAASEILSARIEGVIEMTGLDEASAGLSEVSMTFTTSFDTRTGNTSFLMDMSSMLDGLETDESDPFTDMFAEMLGEIEFRQIGETAYMRYPFFTAMLGSETPWVSMPADEGQSFSSDFETMPTDPYGLLDTFEWEGVTVEELGTETVNGVEAVHYELSLDVEAMDLSEEEKAELAASGVFAKGVIPMEIWISEDGYMVRMIMEIDGSGIDLPPEEQFDTMVMRYDVFDVNGEVTIDPPPDSQVTPIEELEQGFLGFDTLEG